MSNKRTPKKSSKTAKNNKRLVIFSAVLFVIVIIAVAIGIFKPEWYHKYLGGDDHTWTEWEITDATCGKDGSKTHECTVCGEKETEVVSATGEHIWTEWEVTEATCNENGSKSRECTVCGDNDIVTIPATSEHTWTEWAETEVTCGKDGSKTRECSVCGDKETELVPATGEHTWTEWEITEVTCNKDGSKMRECTVCGEKETEVISATGEHTWTEWKETEATCNEDGSKTRECTVCGDMDIVSIPATGKHNYNDDNICTVCGFDNNAPSAEAVLSAELSIHFLELGNKYTGDCTLIKCGNTEVLIDAGSRNNSAATIKSYVDQYCTDGVLEYVIATHAHQDHIAGFVGNSSGGTKTGILYQYKIGTLIQFAGTNATSQIYKDYCTAVEYAQSKGTTVYTAAQCYYQTDGAKKQYFLDNDNKISMNILYNYYYDHTTKDENDYSVCMLLTQATEAKTFNYLFTGDLEEKGEGYLVDNNQLPQVELFKGGHHGSYTASTEKLLRVIKPKNVAVCCCCGTTEYTSNKDNTFPAQAFIDRVAKYTENVYCTTLILDYKASEYTSMNGNIVFYTQGASLKLWCSNNDTKLKDTDWFKENRTWNA